MKLVVVGHSSENASPVSHLIEKIRQSGIQPDVLICTSGYQQSLDLLGSNQKIDLILIPKDVPLDFIKQIKRTANPVPVIFQDKGDGDFRILTSKTAIGIIHGSMHAKEQQVHEMPDMHHALMSIQTIPADTRNAGAQYSFSESKVSTPQVKIRDRFIVRIASKLRPVSIDEIAYFYADNRLNFLATWEGQKFVINHSMEELAKQVSPLDFFRISRSFIISYKSIDMIQVQERNRLKVMLTPGFRTDVFVSRDKVSGFRSWIGE